jgi:ABC-type dipeptide/oligopeptide/nickel transport system permease component
MNSFIGYTLRRLALLPLGVFVVVSLSFGLVSLVPGDPARAIAGGLASEETLDGIRAELGLDQPFATRYSNYVTGLARFDLGRSFVTEQPVRSEIWDRMPDSIELIVMSLAVATILGLALGGVGAYFRGRALDRATRLLTSAIQSIPDFFLGVVLIYLLFYILGWAPAPVGRIGLGEARPPDVTGGLLTDAVIAGDWAAFWSGLRHSIMPVLALGLFYSAYFAKTTRAVLGTAFASRQVEFARACGLPTRTIWAYALRDARTPIMTYGAILFAVLIGGAAIVEIVFAWGGVGQWAVERILALDIPAIQGFVLFAGIITLLTYVTLDIIVARLDPRITYESRS